MEFKAQGSVMITDDAPSRSAIAFAMTDEINEPG
jgi:hypothetical protein